MNTTMRFISTLSGRLAGLFLFFVLLGISSVKAQDYVTITTPSGDGFPKECNPTGMSFQLNALYNHSITGSANLYYQFLNESGNIVYTSGPMASLSGTGTAKSLSFQLSPFPAGLGQGTWLFRLAAVKSVGDTLFSVTLPSRTPQTKRYLVAVPPTVKIFQPDVLVDTSIPYWINDIDWDTTNALSGCPDKINEYAIEEVTSQYAYPGIANLFDWDRMIGPAVDQTNLSVNVATYNAGTDIYVQRHYDYYEPSWGSSSTVSHDLPASTASAGDSLWLRMTGNAPSSCINNASHTNIPTQKVVLKGLALDSITGANNVGTYCKGGNMMVYFTGYGLTGGQYTVEVSDENGNYASPLATLNGTTSPITVAIPGGATDGTQYKLRVSYSNNPCNNIAESSTFKIAFCPPEINAPDVTAIPDPVCAGDSVDVTITLQAGNYLPGNVFYVLLSDSVGNFPGKVGKDTIGRVAAISGPQTVRCHLPENVSAGAYKVRVFANSPASFSTASASFNVSSILGGGGQAVDAAIFNTTPVVANGKEYFISKVKREWTEARDLCIADGGHLVTITNQAENDIVKNLMPDGNESIWLGLTDAAKEGTWVWITGEPVTYTNWAGGEPNDQNNEDYAHMWKSRGLGTWNDNQGYKNYYFVMERTIVSPIQSVVQPQSNAPICGGEDLILQAAALPNVTYTWTGPNGFTAGPSNSNMVVRNNVTTADAGTYRLEINRTATPLGCMVQFIDVSINPAATGLTALTLQNNPVAAGCNDTATFVVTNLAVGEQARWYYDAASLFPINTVADTFSIKFGTTDTLYVARVSTAGCEGPRSSAIGINNSPLPLPVITGPATVCVNDSIELRAPKGYAEYFWEVGSNAILTTTDSIIKIDSADFFVSQNDSIGIRVAVRDTADLGCVSWFSDEFFVELLQLPAAPTGVSSNGPVCEGDTLKLMADAVTGGTFNWTGPNSFSNNAEDPMIYTTTAASAGSYSVTVSVNGCTSPASSTNVGITALPAAPTNLTTNSPVCEGIALTFDCDPVTGGSFTWTGPDNFLANTKNASVTSTTEANTGTYSVTVTQNGCTSPAATINATVDTLPAAPTANDNSTCGSGSLILTATGAPAGGGYNWYSNATGGTPIGSGANFNTPNISSTTTYYVSSLSALAGCESTTRSAATATVVATITPTVSVNTITTAPICANDTAWFSAVATGGGTAATFEWFVNNVSAGTNDSLEVLTPTNGDEIKVVLTSSETCATPTTVADSITITVQPLPTIPGGFTGNTTPCLNAQEIYGVGNAANTTFNWTLKNNNGNIGTPAANQTNITWNTAGIDTIYVTATDACGTTQPLAVEIDVQTPPAAPTALASGNTTPCQGATETYSLTPVAGVTFNWQLQNGIGNLSTATGDQTNITWNTAGPETILVTATDVCGSSPAAQFSINVRALAQTPVLAASPNTVCTGNTVTVSLTPEAGITYTWSGNPVTSSNSMAEYVFNTSGTQTINASVSGGCSAGVADGSVNVTVNATPAKPAITASGSTNICQGQTVDLSLPTGLDAYNWSNNQSSASISVSNSGTFTATVTENGCQSESSDAITVTVNPLPVPVVTADTTIGLGESVTLTASGGSTYNWSPATGLSDAASPMPVASPDNTTTYTVTVGTNAGCTASADVTVTVIVRSLDPMKGITPNGDGQNDTWEIPGLIQYPQAQFYIYNRWGTLLYESEPGDTSWDARIDGTEVAAGTYYYVLKLNNSQNDSKSGYITVIK